MENGSVWLYEPGKTSPRVMEIEKFHVRDRTADIFFEPAAARDVSEQDVIHMWDLVSTMMPTAGMVVGGRLMARPYDAKALAALHGMPREALTDLEIEAWPYDGLSFPSAGKNRTHMILLSSAGEANPLTTLYRELFRCLGDGTLSVSEQRVIDMAVDGGSDGAAPRELRARAFADWARGRRLGQPVAVPADVAAIFETFISGARGAGLKPAGALAKMAATWRRLMAN